MKITVVFTGICGFVEHQGGAMVVVPNLRGIRSVKHEGGHTHVPGHIPYVEFATAQTEIAEGVPPLFSYHYHGRGYDVVELATNTAGWLLQFKANDGGKFTSPPVE